MYGNDWFLVPLEVPSSSLTLFDRIVVRDVFDRTHLIGRAGRDDPDWTMFTLHGPDPQHPAADALLMLPAGLGQPGDVLEPALSGELPAYAVQTIVPDYWFPLVPEQVAPAVIRFRLAQLIGPGAQPEGRLIAEGLWMHEEEVPREGATVIRRPVLGRWFNGSWHRWVRREKSAGTGESSSGLAFDTVRPSEPWPR